MKRKDVTYLIITVVILAATGIMAYFFLFPQKSTGTGAKSSYEVITPIDATLTGDKLNRILDSTKLKDFSVPVDLKGLGNTTPFGPLQ